MREIFCRVTLRKPTFSGPVLDLTTCSGYLVDFDPGTPPTLEILRRVDPDEPDPEIEVGYSPNALEPTTIVFKEKKKELTLTLYRMFRYVYDLCRAEGKTEFDFAEIPEAITGDPAEIGKSAMESNIKRLRSDLASMNAPIDVTYSKEKIYVEAKNSLAK